MSEKLSPKKHIQAIISLIFLGFGGKFCGLVRNVIMAQQFGSNGVTDAFVTALAGMILFTSLALAVSNSIIILYNKLDHSHQEKLKMINNILHVVVVVSIFLIALCYFLAPGIIHVLSSGFTGEQFDLTVYLFRVSLPIILIYNITGSLRGYLNAENSFMEFGFVQYTLNITVIIYLLFFSHIWGIKGLMVAQVIGCSLQLLVQIPFLRKTGFKYIPFMNLRDKEVRQIFYIGAPIFLGLAINDINVIVDKTLASQLQAGSITALDYGSRINDMVLAIVITPLTMVLLPSMSRAFNSGEYGSVRKSYSLSITFLFVVILPISAYLMIYATPVIALLFGRGHFGAEAIYMSSLAMTFYTFGLVSAAGSIVGNKAYYALNDTKTPFIFSFVNVVTNFTLDMILVRFMGLGGLALATALTSWIVFFIRHVFFCKRISYTYVRHDIKIMIQALLGTALTVCVVLWTKSYFATMGITSNGQVMLLGIGVGLPIYALYMVTIMKQSMLEILQMVKKA